MFRAPGCFLLLRALPALLLIILSRPAAADVDRWTPLGPDGGEIWSVAADPAAPGTVYAGTSGGGVWKSLDGGGHWLPTPEGLGIERVLALVASSGRVLAGTDSGIFLLTEGAATWRRVWRTGGQPWLAYVPCLAADPTSPNRFLAATGSGYVLWSEDGGEHWRMRLDLEDCGAVAVAPTAPSTAYVASEDGVFKSTDAGATWSQIVPHLAEPTDGPGRTDALVVDSAAPDTLYVRGWKSTDAGETWTQLIFDVPDDLFYLLPRPLVSLPGALLGMDDDGLLRSENGGETWEPARFPLFHPLSLAADPATPDGAFVGTEGQGVFRLLDGGRAWAESRRGLAASDITGFAFDPFQPGTLYAGTLGTGMHRSVDGGASWSRMTRITDGLGELAADPHHPGTLYALVGNGGTLLVSRDRGDHWHPIQVGGLFVALDPQRPGTIFVGGERIFRSSDGGRTWKALPSPRGKPLVTTRMFFAPWSPETFYFLNRGRLSGSSALPRALVRSTDGGETQETIFRFPAALAIDPQTPGLLYVARNLGEIWRSRDGGTTWKRIARKVGGGALLTELLVDAIDPSILYLGTDREGVWRSRDGGVTWERFSTGIIAPHITCLKADPLDPRHLIACTRAGGLLDIRLSS